MYSCVVKSAFTSPQRKQGLERGNPCLLCGLVGRRGFTLIELLVVMALIAILASLMIAFFPNAASAQREARAATLVQSWLNIAKQRALRDQAPRGLRLWYATNYFSGATPLSPVVTDCQYIEQPPDFPGATSVTAMSTNAAALNTVMFMPSNVGILLNGYLPVVQAQAEYWSVQPGDYLEVLGNGMMHQITAVGVPSADFVTISPPLVNTMQTTTNFRILRAPRVAGNETLKLPDFTLIDLGTNTEFPVKNALPAPNIIDNGTANYVDILFSPTGAVITPGVTTNTINLWVRSPSEDSAVAAANPFRGDPTIVAVFVRTGFVGAFPPDPNTANPTYPYTYVK